MNRFVILFFFIPVFFFSQENGILIFGNSITFKDPEPQIGWFEGRGMAASKPENDYVHTLVSMARKDGLDLRFYSLNIAPWERDYLNFNLEENYSIITDLTGIEILIIQLGDNVDGSNIGDGSFKKAYIDLIYYLTSTINVKKVILISRFWPGENINSIIREQANSINAVYVDISNLYSNKVNTAWGQYDLEFINKHPSDIGMQKIAEAIFPVIRSFQEVILK